MLRALECWKSFIELHLMHSYTQALTVFSLHRQQLVSEKRQSKKVYFWRSGKSNSKRNDIFSSYVAH